MRSMRDIMCAVVDGEINTKAAAAALVNEEAAQVAQATGTPIEEARAVLLSNIGYCTGYYDNDFADQVLELFETEHPIFGRGHPTAEEALKMGMEWAAIHMKKEREA